LDATGAVITNVFDPNTGLLLAVSGRLEFETNSIGVVTRTVYNAVGWVTASTNLTTGAWAA